jgi:anaerobic selenocysteine-containing dehydrogenase
MMSGADSARLGLREGDAVIVTSATGRMRAVVSFAEIRPGNAAMYYPEANALVPRRVDPASGTPAFKSVAVRLEPAAALRTDAELAASGATPHRRPAPTATA